MSQTHLIPPQQLIKVLLRHELLAFATIVLRIDRLLPMDEVLVVLLVPTAFDAVV